MYTAEVCYYPNEIPTNSPPSEVSRHSLLSNLQRPVNLATPSTFPCTTETSPFRSVLVAKHRKFYQEVSGKFRHSHGVNPSTTKPYRKHHKSCGCRGFYQSPMVVAAQWIPNGRFAKSKFARANTPFATVINQIHARIHRFPRIREWRYNLASRTEVSQQWPCQ